MAYMLRMAPREVSAIIDAGNLRATMPSDHPTMLIKILPGIGLLLGLLLWAPMARATESMDPLVADDPWMSRALSVESGILWEVGTGTTWPYRLVQTQLSWRSREFLKWDLRDGSRFSVRHRFTLLGALMQQGPESHYVALAASPSIEWRNPADKWSLFGGAGGGFGLLDSQGVRGGQGQDFTLNWFARGGIEYSPKPDRIWTAAIMFQHMSNGGATDPNPGIDAVGFMVGVAWKI